MIRAWARASVSSGGDWPSSDREPTKQRPNGEGKFRPNKEEEMGGGHPPDGRRMTRGELRGQLKRGLSQGLVGRPVEMECTEAWRGCCRLRRSRRW